MRCARAQTSVSGPNKCSGRISFQELKETCSQEHEAFANHATADVVHRLCRHVWLPWIVFVIPWLLLPMRSLHVPFKEFLAKVLLASLAATVLTEFSARVAPHPDAWAKVMAGVLEAHIHNCTD